MRTKEQQEEYIKELHIRMLEDIKASKEAIDVLKENDLLDDNGYPTDDALQIIRIWHWSDPKGWFSFIKIIWYVSSWGWHELETEHSYKKDEKVYQYHTSTGGWSGNESIIQAMQDNIMMWHLNWVSSRRGGHYVFELKEFEVD
jgi:hypothetical protein